MKAAVLLVLAACGNEKLDIQVVAQGQPAFSGKIGDGPWQRFAGISDGTTTTYHLAIDDDFELALACSHDGMTSFVELFGTYDDAVISIGSWHLPACESSTPSPGTIAITGNTSGGHLSIGDQTAELGYGRLSFSIDVVPGTRDLVFADDLYDVTVWHDLDLVVPQDLGNLIFHPVPMLIAQYGQSLANEKASGSLELTTRNGTHASWPETLDAAVFMPPEMMEPGDTQELRIATHYMDSSGGRTAIATNVSRVAPQFVLLSRLAPFRWLSGTYTVTWDPLSEYTTSTSARFYTSTREATVTASTLYLERTRANQLALDLTPPGFEIQVDPNSGAELTIESWSSELTLGTFVNQYFR
ncbi:MAG TPA: hypothetical protein VGC41_06605 [Kofleriaceae bacterium]